MVIGHLYHSCLCVLYATVPESVSEDLPPKLTFFVFGCHLSQPPYQNILVDIGRMIIPGVWMQRGCGECYGGGEGPGPASA